MNNVLKIVEGNNQKVFFTSDLHLNHRREFIWEARGFGSSEEHTNFVINKINEIDFNASKDRHAFNEIYERLLKGLQSAGNFGDHQHHQSSADT